MISGFATYPVLAQTVESLVMPGDVIAGHAEIEADCSGCHKRFDRDRQRTLCLDCHEDIAEDISDGRGFHGKDPAASAQQCATCHTDHEGRDARVVLLDEASFDHGQTDYELLGMHRDVNCEGCHATDKKHRAAPGTCVDCHREDDVHETFLGDSCVDCHSENGWLEVLFDHDLTEYPLIGHHQEAACGDCHQARTFQNTADTCIGCHADDDVHEGRSGEQCANCHNPVSWTDTSFDHSRDTEFSLLGQHAQLSCGDCHSDEPFGDELKTTCLGCHAEDDSHEGHFGEACGDCHTADSWPATTFAHNVETNFELALSHESVSCEGCHSEPLYDQAPPTDCISCHLEDDVHESAPASSCADCHNESSWTEAPYFSHDLARFPLLGEHDNIDCNGCHETQEFTAAATACTSCHMADDPHRGNFTENCEGCHNPIAWDLWRFDHSSQTSYPLQGGHAGVACADCHRTPLATMENVGDDCGSCHAADDTHDGEYGSNCGRCHGDTSFEDVKVFQ